MAATCCAGCKMELSNLRHYKGPDIWLCPYCEMIPEAMLQSGEQHFLTVVSRMLTRLEQRILEQDSDIPLRLPVHDQALGLVMAMAAESKCAKCGAAEGCNCDYFKVFPEDWQHAAARKIMKEARRK